MNDTVLIGLALVLVLVGGLYWIRATLAAQVTKVRVQDADELRARQDLALGGIRSLFGEVQRFHAKLVGELRQRAPDVEANTHRAELRAPDQPAHALPAEEKPVARAAPTPRAGTPLVPQPAASSPPPPSPRLPASMDARIADRYAALCATSGAAGEAVEHCGQEQCQRGSPSTCRCPCAPCRRAITLLLQAQREPSPSSSG
jgi:hypothetical protein